MQIKITHPLEPVVFTNSKTLILGSFPSLKSFENKFYYSHKRNQFWTILSTVYDLPTNTKDEKIELLKIAKIALWDMVASCERTNSADSNLKNCIPNDIEEFLKGYLNIERIFFTGRTAEKLYIKHFRHLNVSTALLPSPSPAYATMKLEEKVERWKEYILN